MLHGWWIPNFLLSFVSVLPAFYFFKITLLELWISLFLLVTPHQTESPLRPGFKRGRGRGRGFKAVRLDYVPGHFSLTDLIKILVPLSLLPLRMKWEYCLRHSNISLNETTCPESYIHEISVTQWNHDWSQNGFLKGNLKGGNNTRKGEKKEKFWKYYMYWKSSHTLLTPVFLLLPPCSPFIPGCIGKLTLAWDASAM